MATAQNPLQVVNNVLSKFKIINANVTLVVNQYKVVENITNNISNNMNQNVFNMSNMTNAESTLNKISSAVDKIEKRINSAEQNQENFNSSIKEGSKASVGLGKNLMGFASSFVSISALKGYAEAIDTYVNQSSKLSMVNDGLQSQAQLQNKVFAAAERSRGSYGDMVNTVSELSAAGKNVFSNNDETIAFAELMNKSFDISGASPDEKSSGIDQITQAMASGGLQGDGFTELMASAPLVADAISNFTGKSMADLQLMASNGELSASLIKNALFSSADEINSKFAVMPRTFGQVWQSVKNNAIMQFSEIMQKVNDFLNGEKGTQIVNGIINAIGILATVVGWLLGVLFLVSDIFVNNWGMIEPIIYGIAAAMVVLNAKTWIAWLMTVKNTIAMGLKTIASWADIVAIVALTIATDGLSVALKACPLNWLLMIIIAIITIFYVIIGAINQFAGTSLSATGIIIGAFLALGALIWNQIVAVVNGLIQFVWAYFVEPFISIIEFVLNVFNGGFNSFGDAVKNLLGNIISWFFSLGTVVTKILDAIFGTNWTDGLNELKGDILKWGKNDKAITLERNAPKGLERMGVGAAFNIGNDIGKNIESKVDLRNMFGGKENPMDKFPKFNEGDQFKDWETYNRDNGLKENVDKNQKVNNQLNNTYGTGNGSNNYSQTATENSANRDSMSGSDEDLTYLRDLTEREVIGRITAPQININMNNDMKVNNSMDLDEVVSHLERRVYETMNVAAEGVYV